MYFILFVLSASGNVAVRVSLLRGRHRRSRIEEMILHLNIADLIVTFIIVPMEIFWRITMEWIAGDTMCRIMMFFRAFGLYLSSMVLVCISIDRFIAIVYTLKVNVAQKRVKYMLRCAWIFSFLSSVPQLIRGLFVVTRNKWLSAYCCCCKSLKFQSMILLTVMKSKTNNGEVKSPVLRALKSQEYDRERLVTVGLR
ncbi:gonadotropin-releasing hormone receptor [Caerostris darwini]|uniref:Gonadotropin-releasing hormone receptor n=1 Tax=Caerostris darwini TaxID=1538125 RepID=A0AAV4MCM5_9ARAC|nr:gonadotropin-releasing hormone receptor [Caerostris darwini]